MIRRSFTWLDSIGLTSQSEFSFFVASKTKKTARNRESGAVNRFDCDLVGSIESFDIEMIFFFGVSRASPLAHQKKIVKKRESFRRRPQRRPLQPFEFQTVPDCSRLFQAVPGRLCSRKELCCSWCASPASTSSTTTVTTTTFCFLDLKKKQSAKKIDAVFSLNEFRFGQKEKKNKQKNVFFSQAVFSALGVDFLEMLIYSDKSRLRHPRNAKRTKKKNIIFFLYNFFFCFGET